MLELKVGDKVKYDTAKGVCPHNGETFTVEFVYPPEKDPEWRGGETNSGDDMRTMVAISVNARPDEKHPETGALIGGGARIRGRLRADRLIPA